MTGLAYRSDRSRGYKYPFTCVRLIAAFVTRPWIVLSPKPPPLCSSPPVHLFRVDLNVVGGRTLVDLLGKEALTSSCPLGGFESIHLLILCLV